MKQILLAGLLGGVTLYIWGAISWSLLPWHTATLREVPNTDAVTDVIQKNVSSTGTYLFPSVPTDDMYSKMSDAERSGWSEKYSRGPIGRVVVFLPGRNPMSSRPFISALVVDLLAALIAAYLVFLARASLVGFRNRVLFLSLIGVAVALLAPLSEWNWGFETAGYSIAAAVDSIIGCTLAGVPIAWRIKP